MRRRRSSEVNQSLIPEHFKGTRLWKLGVSLCTDRNRMWTCGMGFWLATEKRAAEQPGLDRPSGRTVASAAGQSPGSCPQAAPRRQVLPGGAGAIHTLPSLPDAALTSLAPSQQPLGESFFFLAGMGWRGQIYAEWLAAAPGEWRKGGSLYSLTGWSLNFIKAYLSLTVKGGTQVTFRMMGRELQPSNCFTFSKKHYIWQNEKITYVFFPYK